MRPSNPYLQGITPHNFQASRDKRERRMFPLCSPHAGPHDPIYQLAQAHEPTAVLVLNHCLSLLLSHHWDKIPTLTT